MRTLTVEAGVVLSFTENGAETNPQEPESFWSRFKSENNSLPWEAETPNEVIKIVGRQIGYYSTKWRHSSLAYRGPLEYLHHEGILPSCVAEINSATGSNLRAQDPATPLAT